MIFKYILIDVHAILITLLALATMIFSPLYLLKLSCVFNALTQLQYFRYWRDGSKSIISRPDFFTIIWLSPCVWCCAQGDICEQTGLVPTFMSLLICEFFSINMNSPMNVFPFPHDLLNNIIFSVAYFIVRNQYLIHTHKIYVNQLLNVISKALGQ